MQASPEGWCLSPERRGRGTRGNAAEIHAGPPRARSGTPRRIAHATRPRSEQQATLRFCVLALPRRPCLRAAISASARELPGPRTAPGPGTRGAQARGVGLEYFFSVKVCCCESAAVSACAYGALRSADSGRRGSAMAFARSGSCTCHDRRHAHSLTSTSSGVLSRSCRSLSGGVELPAIVLQERRARRTVRPYRPFRRMRTSC